MLLIVHQLEQVLICKVVDLLSGRLVEKVAESILNLSHCISYNTFIFAFFRARSRPITSFSHKIARWQSTKIATGILLGLRVRVSGQSSFLLEARVVVNDSRRSLLLHLVTVLVVDKVHTKCLRFWSYHCVATDGIAVIRILLIQTIWYPPLTQLL